MLDFGGLGALLSVVLIDVALAGDNAVVVGMAASGLAPPQRNRAILAGVLVATGLRIALAAVAVQLLAIVGLTLAGGFLLLWVVWKSYRDLASGHRRAHRAGSRPSGFARALLRIVAADLSMSLDNVLAVAGTARGRVWVLVAGLTLSVALMGAASAVMARLIGRYRFLAWVGLAIVTFVALRMIYDGWAETAALFSGDRGGSKNWLS